MRVTLALARACNMIASSAAAAVATSSATTTQHHNKDEGRGRGRGCCQGCPHPFVSSRKPPLWMGNLLPLLLLMRPCNLRQPHMFSFVIKMFDNFIRDPSSNKASGPRYDPHRELIPIVRLAGWQSWHTLNLSLIPRVRLTTLAANCQPRSGLFPVRVWL